MAAGSTSSRDIAGAVSARCSRTRRPHLRAEGAGVEMASGMVRQYIARTVSTKRRAARAPGR